MFRYLSIALREFFLVVLFLLFLPIFFVIAKFNKEFAYNMKYYVDSKIELLENLLKEIEEEIENVKKRQG